MHGLIDNSVNLGGAQTITGLKTFSGGGRSISDSENNAILTTESHKYTDVNNIKFGNGLIIQWGKTDTPQTVTFSTPYTEIPTVLITQNRSNANERNCMVNTITTTSFKTLRYGSESAGNGLEWFSIGV